jgi:DNA mismatch repair protein MutS
MMKDNNTPLIRQYLQIKSKYPDFILLYRMGDFYETFFEDAETTARVCNIVLTKRNNGAAGDVPLAGFPYHQLDNYLPKLVNAGLRVAVCEQVEDPKQAKGIVRREVTEVVTPGVTLYDKLLSEKRNNYIASIYFHPRSEKHRTLGLAFCDVSTGEFNVSEFSIAQLIEILDMLGVKEVVISKEQKEIFENISKKLNNPPLVTKLEPWIFDLTFAREALLGQLRTLNLKGFGLEELPLGITSAGALLYYINETQKLYLNQIQKISFFNPSEYMILDSATRRNLEIYFSWSNNIEGSLYSVLDNTKTPMGGRLLKNWIAHPLLNVDKINQRLEIVDYFYKNEPLLEKIENLLSEIGDLERLSSKICSTKAYPRELIVLKKSIDTIPYIQKLLQNTENQYLNNLSSRFLNLQEISSLIEKAIDPNTNNNIGEGNVIRKGYSEEFDKIVSLAHNSKSHISKLQDEERKRTGIQSLKIGYNLVFGYYIEISKANASKVPSNYIRKQTLTNAERYITPELREIELKLLNIEEKLRILETQLYQEVLLQIARFTAELQETSQIIAELDCLTNFARLALKNRFSKPIVDNGTEIIIQNGRHPVVEQNLPIGERYIPNSTKMNEDELIHIITGPNMSGKSCYLRQVALIVLLAQIGCFVPADSAKIGIVDRIFTRVGAQDDITRGESTFLIEMQESANILNNATSKSLILLDEVGRGTATFDGISIAWAITEYIHNNIGAKTLFATHYHELNELEAKYDKIVNYYIEVLEEGEKVIFTHKVKKGTSDHSFGIYVAEMAGLPKEVVQRAKDILDVLESGATSPNEQFIFKVDKPNPKNIKSIEKKLQFQQLAIFDFTDTEIRDKILDIDINNITPLQAIKFLEELQKQIKSN